jgi:hypothetical protein
MTADKPAEGEASLLLEVVALLADLPEQGLSRGQVGTIVQRLDAWTLLVEFSDDRGCAYAITPCRWADLLVLRWLPSASS